jgi:vitamin B12 transporter
MTRRFFNLLLAALALAVPAAGRPAAGMAQQPASMAAALAALDTCAAGAAAGAPREEQQRSADRAERLFREVLRSDPAQADGRVGLAQVLIRCQLPHATVTGVMALISDAEQELRAVLAEQPDHWSARFTLAMLLRNMPAMLGRGGDAVREFERLLALQGTRVEGPHFALPFLHLGELHESAGRSAAAVAVWRRGLALFPEHDLLRARLLAAGVEARPDSSWLADGAAVVAAPSLDVPVVHALAPLRVEGTNHHFQETRAGTTLRRLDVFTMPGGTGEMLQALQAMPGATRAGDGAELYIRGGDPAETPVFFDGGRLAFPGRWESLQGSAMGVVDAAVLRRAYFSSGGFSARYGNALSGVVDVETEGRPAQASQRVGVNMVQAGGTVRTQAGERTGAWLTASATDTRLINRMTGESEFYSRSPQSAQGIASLSFEPLPGVELRTTALAVADRYGRLVTMGGHAGEFASASSMQHVALSGRAVQPDGRRGLSGSVTASRRANRLAFGVLDRDRVDQAFGGRVDGDVVMSGATRVRGGLEVLGYHAAATGRVPTSPALAPGSPAATLPGESESAGHGGGYLEVEHAPTARLAVVAGVRTDALPGETGAFVDPRVGAAWSAGDWTLRAGAGVFQQGRWRARFTLPDPGQPSGTPRRAEHMVAGVERGGILSLRLEGYTKRYGDYVPAGAGPAIVAGSSRGIDAIARWSPRQGPGGWLSYSLLRGRVQLADGREVASALDVTHSVTSVVRTAVGRDWELGATARYATGRPFTPMQQDAAGNLEYGTVHAERLPDYRRLDGRVTRYLMGESRASGLVYLEMLNLLHRQNVMGYTWATPGAGRVPINSVFAHRTFVLGVELQY